LFFAKQLYQETVSVADTTASHPSARKPADSELDVTELVTLFGETVAALKRSAPPPPKLLGALEHSTIGARHLPALEAVTLAGPLSVSDLARRLGHTLPTTSTIVGQLSRAGLVERAEDEQDRRRTIVRVNDDYAEEIGAWAEMAFSPLRVTLERLAPEARASFMAGWRILHEETLLRAGDDEGCRAPG